jgi:signal transduction histidine kinase
MNILSSVIKLRLIKVVLISLSLAYSFTVFSNERNILVIHSYHQGLEWTDSISSGILSVFKGYPEYNLYFEYIDTKRNNTENYLESVVDLYRSRTSKIEYDAIIVSDNAAYEFMLNHRDDFFPGVPVFFCGVNFLDVSTLVSHEKFFGFEEVADHRGTLNMIMELFPERKKVLIINDYTLTGSAILKELEKVLPEYQDKLSFEIIASFSIDELKQRVASLSDDYTIYLLVVNMDRLGNYISYNTGIRIIQENTAAPIFGSWDFYLGKGILGGSITKGYEHGKSVAQLVFNYLTEAEPNPTRYQQGKSVRVLDYNLLKEFDIDNQSIDSDVQVINKPGVPVWQVLALKIIIVVLVFLLLITVMLVLTKKAQTKKLKELVELKTKELSAANEDLKKINQSKNEILGIVAHDLRNPIGNISGFSEYLIDEDNNKKVFDAETREYLDIISDLSIYMLRLVNNLLDISVIESGVLNLDMKADDYIAFIAEELERNRALVNKKQIKTEFHCKIEQATLKFDKLKIRQVFGNLFSNALKFTPSGGKIIITVEGDDTKIITRIKDSGPGIPKDKFDSIFEKFKQLDSNVETKSKGTGLGLSIVKGIVEGHKGKVYVTSTLNVGSEFVYELPLKTE